MTTTGQFEPLQQQQQQHDDPQETSHEERNPHSNVMDQDDNNNNHHHEPVLQEEDQSSGEPLSTTTTTTTRRVLSNLGSWSWTLCWMTVMATALMLLASLWTANPLDDTNSEDGGSSSLPWVVSPFWSKTSHVDDPSHKTRHLGSSVLRSSSSLSRSLRTTSATLDSIQPTWRDEVHAVWVNGPLPRQQLGTEHWPLFGRTNTSDATPGNFVVGGSTSGTCSPNLPTFTGYTNDGTAYCQPTNGHAQEHPHLLLYSGNLGVLLDASYTAKPTSVVARIGSTQHLAIDGSLVRDASSSPSPVVNDTTTGTGTTTGTTNDPTTGTTTNRSTTDEPTGPSFLSAQDVLNGLPEGTVRLSLQLLCENHGLQELVAQPLADQGGAPIHLIRQGPAVVHVTIDALQWTDFSGQAQPFVFAQNDNCVVNTTNLQDPETTNANDTCLSSIVNCCLDDPCFCQDNYISGVETNSCPHAEYPHCVFESPGSSWGTCHALSTAPRDPSNITCNTNADCFFDPNYPVCLFQRCYVDVERDCTLAPPWIDVTMWGDTLSLVANWDPNTRGDTCQGSVRLETRFAGGTQPSTTLTQTAPYDTGRVSMILSSPMATTNNDDDDRSTTNTDISDPDASTYSQPLVDATETAALIDDVTVTASSGTNVLYRTIRGDIVVEVPPNTPRCSYNSNCGDVSSMVNVTVANEQDNATRTVRLTLSRSFETGNPRFGPPESARPGAEITGLSVLVLDAMTLQPLGIPVQLSKNWHTGQAINPTYRFRWWTANVLLHLPPTVSVDLTFAIVYEEYMGVPAFSQAQLSTVGLASRWMLQQASLGTGGDNFVVDPMGAFSRNMITSVRANFFDGAWKQDVGGGDFLVYFDQSGRYQYATQVTPRLLAHGPCLSNASYTMLSDDGAIRSEIQMSGARTDDIVRMFIHVRHVALERTRFSRLAFFQMGSETYNLFPTFDNFVFGTAEDQPDVVERTCSAGTSRSADKMYSINDPYFKRSLAGSDGPWWIALGPNSDSTRYQSNRYVVGDRGLVIRSYDGLIQGTPVTRPSVTILCDKIELGPPRSARSLLPGDFVDFKLEFLVLPRSQDFDIPLQRQPNSSSLLALAELETTAERVQEHAIRDIEISSTGDGVDRVECHYPIRVCVTDGWNADSDPLSFTVRGQALGYVPVVLCNLDTPILPDGMSLWSRWGEEEDFTELTDNTEARQANYLDRVNQKYELVFNVEIQLPDIEELGLNETNSTMLTEFFFGTEETLLRFQGRGTPISAAVTAFPHAQTSSWMWIVSWLPSMTLWLVLGMSSFLLVAA